MPKTAPLLSKLRKLAHDIIYSGYAGGGAAFAEPPVSAFSRGLVDSDNNLLLSVVDVQALLVLLQSAPAGSSATVGMTTGDNMFVVSGLGLAEVPSGVICTLMKNGGGSDNIGWNVDYDSLSEDGFVVYFDAPLPAGYYLSYVLLTGTTLQSLVSQSSTVSVPTGNSSVTISGLGLASAPSGAICTLLKSGGGSDNIGVNPDYLSLSTDGFTAYFNAPVPVGYYLSYVLLK